MRAFNLSVISSLFLAVCCQQICISQSLPAKTYKLWFNQPAPNRGANYKIVKANGKPFDEDWENWSLPIGNGYLGACLFGRTDTERIQLTENSLSNKGLYNIGSLTSFAELLIDFQQKDIQNYTRSLTLDDAIARVNYTFKGVNYSREYFASYPDKVLVIKLMANRKASLSFKVNPVIPYLKNPDTSSLKDGRTGRVYAEKNVITLIGNMQYYNIDYEGQIKVIHYGGNLIASNDSLKDHGTLEVKDSDSALILVALGTNYQLKSSVFIDSVPANKLQGFQHPHKKVTTIIENASAKSYDQLMKTHLLDYQNLFSRVKMDLNATPSSLPTDQLLANYKKGVFDHYLEELYFQYGRYLLICSSRKGTLPANLQGIWSQYDVSPWTSGYWHNVNVQMNYWPVFNTNLAELFSSYADYNMAFRALGYKNADAYVKKNNPQAYDSIYANNGWAIGTAASPYSIHGPGGHSGPGTGGFTTKLFWDHFDFTRDYTLLEKVDYPAMFSMANFLTKVVKDSNGLFLANPSSSPEQKVNKQYYITVGCAFDQQMIFESHNDVLKASKLLKDNNKIVELINNQILHLDPVKVGWSGQIKEYREENKYGEIGEYNHRHISQLVGLYPGTLINSRTPAWLDAARVSLNERGDVSKGWSMAHRLNAWARIKDGNRAYKLFQDLLQQGTFDNLWDSHPPFQIDGNFGGTAGIAEMLLQSHEGFIEPLAALPDSWNNGSFKGLVARGNFEIDVQWENKQAKSIIIYSKVGGICKLKFPYIGQAQVQTSNAKQVLLNIENMDRVSFETLKGEKYIITNIPASVKVPPPVSLTMENSNADALLFKWSAEPQGANYKLYVACDSEPDYKLVAAGIISNSFKFKLDSIKMNERATFKITAINNKGEESEGAFAYWVNSKNNL